MTGRIGTTKQLFPVQQAFASEKAFGVLSETLYELLQLVSKSVLCIPQENMPSPPQAEEGAMLGKVLNP